MSEAEDSEPMFAVQQEFCIIDPATGLPYGVATYSMPSIKSDFMPPGVLKCLLLHLPSVCTASLGNQHQLLGSFEIKQQQTIADTQQYLKPQRVRLLQLASIEAAADTS
eukprot:jgi/Chrzof1/128/Cz01g04110.t1